MCNLFRVLRALLGAHPFVSDGEPFAVGVMAKVENITKIPSQYSALCNIQSTNPLFEGGLSKLIETVFIRDLNHLYENFFYIL